MLQQQDYMTLLVYVPVPAVEQVKQALFDAGAGQLGCYDSCAWQVLGEGQFRPTAGAQPAIGQVDTLTTVPEYRLEVLCHSSKIQSAIAALKATHPYETPAYAICPIVTSF